MCWNQYIFQGICWNQSSQADQALHHLTVKLLAIMKNDERETCFLNLYEKISFPFLSSSHEHMYTTSLFLPFYKALQVNDI